MKEKEDEIEEIRNLMIEKTDKMEKVLKNVARVLASNTNYATMVSVPQYSGNKLKFIQLSRVNEQQLVAVVVCEGNVIRNQIIDLDEEMDDETTPEAESASEYQSERTADPGYQSGNDRQTERTGRYSQRTGGQECWMQLQLRFMLMKTIMEIYTSGATNFFKYPELSDKTRGNRTDLYFRRKAAAGRSGQGADGR